MGGGKKSSTKAKSGGGSNNQPAKKNTNSTGSNGNGATKKQQQQQKPAEVTKAAVPAAIAATEAVAVEPAALPHNDLLAAAAAEGAAVALDGGAEGEAMKSGMISDLVSMLRLMEEAPPDSVEEFLQYLQSQVNNNFADQDETADLAAEMPRFLGNKQSGGSVADAISNHQFAKRKAPAANKKAAATAAKPNQQQPRAGAGLKRDYMSDEKLMRLLAGEEPIHLPELAAMLTEQPPASTAQVEEVDDAGNAIVDETVEDVASNSSVSLADDDDADAAAFGAANIKQQLAQQGSIAQLLDALFSGDSSQFTDADGLPILPPKTAGAGEGREVVEDPLSAGAELDEKADGMPFAFLEEDLRDINSIISKLAPLSQDTLDRLSDIWHLNTEGVDHLMMRTNVAERIRCLAVLYLFTVGRKFGAIPQNTLDDLVENLSLCLWQGAALLGPKSQQHVAVLFDLEANASHEQICITVTGLGLTTFFAPLELDLLKNIHRELQLPELNVADKDQDIMTEKITHAVCCYFYPELKSRNDMRLNCTVHLQVHENGPGRYTCTVDNARMMSVGLNQRYYSNTFSLNKIRFRATLRVRDQKLTFFVAHRNDTPLTAAINVRTAGSGKGKKPASPTGNEAPGAFELRCQQEVAPGAPLGFEDMLTLDDVFRNPRSSPNGLRLYGDDDRVTFQFTVDIVSSVTAKPGATKQQQGKGAKNAPAQEKSAPAKGKGGKGTDKPAPDAKAPGVTIEQLIAEEEADKKKKNAKKNAEKFEKRLQQLEATESVARETVSKGAAQSLAVISEEMQKSWKQCLHAKQEKERREEQARDELQGQAASLQSQVSQAKTQVSKLTGERTTLNKELSKVNSNVAQRETALEALRKKVQEAAEELRQQEAELESLTQQAKDREQQREEYEQLREERIRRRAEKDERRKAREEAKAARLAEAEQARLEAEQRAASAPSGEAPTAIRDFQSFWSSGDSLFNTSDPMGGTSSPFTQQGPPPPQAGLSTPPSYGAPSGPHFPPNHHHHHHHHMHHQGPHRGSGGGMQPQPGPQMMQHHHHHHHRGPQPHHQHHQHHRAGSGSMPGPGPGPGPGGFPSSASQEEMMMETAMASNLSAEARPYRPLYPGQGGPGSRGGGPPPRQGPPPPPPTSSGGGGGFTVTSSNGPPPTGDFAPSGGALPLSSTTFPPTQGPGDQGTPSTWHPY